MSKYTGIKPGIFCVLSLCRSLNRVTMKKSFLHSLKSVWLVVGALLFSPQLLAGLMFEEQALTAWDADAYDAFGSSVAISGDYAVVGAPYDDDFGTNSGSVYVFVYTPTGWVFMQKLNASDASEHDQFGRTVDIDGDTIVIGSRDALITQPTTDPLGISAGAVYVFTRSAASWFQQAKLDTSDPPNDFGASLDLDGDQLIVGAPQDSFYGDKRGAAYIFERNAGNWSIQEVHRPSLYSDNEHFGDSDSEHFGEAVSISGGWAAVGAPDYLQPGADARNGIIYIYQHSGSGTWSEFQDIRGSWRYPYIRHGKKVKVQGNTLVYATGYSSGGTYRVVEYNGSSWEKVEILDAGENRDISISGGKVLVGGHLFVRPVTGWLETPYPGVSPDYILNPDSTSASLEGNTAITGFPGYDGGSLTSSGIAYIHNFLCDVPYSLPHNSWRQIALPCDPGNRNTVEDIFGDDGLGTYGTDWIVFGYDVSTGYFDPGLTGELQQGIGYWIIQLSGNTKNLDMPAGSTPVSAQTGCAGDACFTIPVGTNYRQVTWNMIGHPFPGNLGMSLLRVKTDVAVCSSGCDLDLAEANGLFHNTIWTYSDGDYKTYSLPAGELTPWTGYWSAALENASGTGLSLLAPKI